MYMYVIWHGLAELDEEIRASEGEKYVSANATKMNKGKDTHIFRRI